MITSVFAALTVYVLTRIMVYGYFNKGFAIGWLVHNLFNWEWIDEYYYG